MNMSEESHDQEIIPSIALLYEIFGFQAQNSSRILDIFNIYKTQTGLKMNPILIEITNDPKIDIPRLSEAKNKTRIFCSSFGSNGSLYLNDIFFKNNLDCIHIDSWSTATSLENLENLCRIQPTDNKVTPVYIQYVKNINSKIYIVNQFGIYLEGLTKEIVIEAEKEGVEVVAITNVDKGEYDPENIIALAKKDKICVFFFLEFPVKYYEQLKNTPGADTTEFNILVSDALADIPTDLDLIKFLNSKNTQLIFAFISDRERETANRYQLLINDPKHPVSDILSLTLGAFDMATILTRTNPSFNLQRKDYLNVYLNKFLDNSDAQYGFYSYRPAKQLELNELVLLFRDRYFYALPS